jgi:hypothetical protein
MNDYFEINNVNNYWAQQANQRADKARMDAQDAINKQHQAESNNKSNVDLIIHLRQQGEMANKTINNLKEEKAVLKSEKEFFENLLSKPMKEIAEKSQSFKETYDEQQLVLSKWILSQKAYAETAIQIGIEAGKTKEDVDKIYKDNVKNVLANTTQHDNNASSNDVLKENVGKIIKRK